MTADYAEANPPYGLSEIPPRIHRQCFWQCGRRAHQLPGRQRRSRELSVWRASPLRHYAWAASSQPRRRPISPTTCARPGLAALAPWPQSNREV